MYFPRGFEQVPISVAAPWSTTNDCTGPSRTLFFFGGQIGCIFEPPDKIHNSSNQWEFQDPKMEVLYHIRPYFGGISPYIALNILAFWVSLCPIFPEHIPTICGVYRFCPHGIPITIWLHGHRKLSFLIGKSSKKHLFLWAISHGYVK